MLISQKYSGKVDLWVAFKQCHKPVAKLTQQQRLMAQHLGNGLDTTATAKTNSTTNFNKGLYCVKQH